MPTTISFPISVPAGVFKVRQCLRQHHPDASLFVVGGAVRDALFRHYHPKQQHKAAKDVDLATDLSEAEILASLRAPNALGVRCHEKQSVDTFGVVFVHVDGEGDFEVAPFRKDIGATDGRHPDRIERGTIEEDALRRDFTINNLFYDLDRQEVLDFNPHGQGIEDVRNQRVRFVGDPFERIREDKLRVLRLVRFFSRYNERFIGPQLEHDTYCAVRQHANLHEHGISAERIQMEFVAGLEQSLRPDRYLDNCAELGLFKALFPELHVATHRIHVLERVRNLRVVLATLLKSNENVEDRLVVELKYPAEVAVSVKFLLMALTFCEADVVPVLREKERHILRSPRNEAEQQQNARIRAEQQLDLSDLLLTLDDPLRRSRIDHLKGYEPFWEKGEVLMARGLTGKEIGREQDRLAREAYVASFQRFLAGET